jgi:hypothetical protein
LFQNLSVSIPCALRRRVVVSGARVSSKSNTTARTSCRATRTSPQTAASARSRRMAAERTARTRSPDRVSESGRSTPRRVGPTPSDQRCCSQSRFPPPCRLSGMSILPRVRHTVKAPGTIGTVFPPTIRTRARIARLEGLLWLRHADGGPRWSARSAPRRRAGRSGSVVRRWPTAYAGSSAPRTVWPVPAGGPRRGELLLALRWRVTDLRRK